MKKRLRKDIPKVRSTNSVVRHALTDLILIGLFISAAAFGAESDEEIRIIELQGVAEIMPAGATTWVLTQTNQALHPGDRLRTREDSRAALKWSDESVVPVGALTEMEILAPDRAGSQAGLNLIKGVISFFHRDKPGQIKILTHGAAASIEGTEFVMRADEENGGGRVSLAVVDGKVQFGNAKGSLLLTNSQNAVVEPGQPPARAPGFIANNLLQWCFYYPAVLNPDDLDLSAEERGGLKPSLDAYRSGDLLEALANYRPSRSSPSDSERIYHAALLLAVGQVEKTEAELKTFSADRKLDGLVGSLHALIAAVKRQPNPLNLNPQRATELLACSYYEQSRAAGDASLRAALELARSAAAVAPDSGFAWERVAELEFGFGRTREAAMALDRSLALSPRNAQALALKGFLEAAQNHIPAAIIWFDRSIAVDDALANARLGRGLCLIHSGQAAAGRSDLLLAAALEPQRAVLRSYLAKALSDAGKDALANKEIARALRLDPGDPTAWLYSALLKQQENRVNDAISDLEKSQALNDNREVFRSKLLLDQDQAVRGANLARMYRDAGMNEVSEREAANAVSEDYANASAHLFLANSFNELRDPTRFNLRYETAWFNELLLANLLAPVGAGQLSQTISAQEYSKLFASDGLGFASQSSWRSDGQYQQLAAQYGAYGNTSWALDLDYHNNEGVRPNNALNSIEWYTTVKQQLTPSDSILLMSKYEDYSSGDDFQYYNPSVSYRPNYNYSEQQQPILIGGFQHEWFPGVQTLALGGRLVTKQQFSDLQAPQLLVLQDATGNDDAAFSSPFDVQVADQLEIYTAEIQQIVQRDWFTAIAGARWQGGQIDFSDSLASRTLPSLLAPAPTGNFSEPFERTSAYGYLTLEPIDHLWITGGAAFDDVEYPSNFRNPPEGAGASTRELLEPKAAMVWNPFTPVTLRGVYSRSLGGVSLDESYRLEPTQLGGFVQTYRSVIPESVVGSLSAESVDIKGLALDLKFKHGTFIGLQANHIDADAPQTVGNFLLANGNAPLVASGTRQELSYEEWALSASLNQLLPGGFVTGLNYRLTHSELRTSYPQIPSSLLPSQDQSAILHQIGFYLLYNHPSGLFFRFDADGYLQSNRGYTPAEPGDEFAQLNLQGGWRFWRRRGELSLGVLNMTGRDYRLNPLTVYSELPRSAVFFGQLSFQF